MGGEGTNYIPGDSGIFVANVRPGTIADGKLYIGDRIVAVCGNITYRLIFALLHTVPDVGSDGPRSLALSSFSPRLMMSFV